MGRFRNVENGVTVSVDGSKDARFGSGLWEPAQEPKKAPAKPAAK